MKPERPEDEEFTIEKGVDVMFPIMVIQRDPEYYPVPDRFDPERFSEENKANIKPGTYLPFGIGPRNCIGNKPTRKIKSVYTFFF